MEGRPKKMNKLNFILVGEVELLKHFTKIDYEIILWIITHKYELSSSS